MEEIYTDYVAKAFKKIESHNKQIKQQKNDRIRGMKQNTSYKATRNSSMKSAQRIGRGK